MLLPKNWKFQPIEQIENFLLQHSKNKSFELFIGKFEKFKLALPVITLKNHCMVGTGFALHMHSNNTEPSGLLIIEGAFSKNGARLMIFDH